MSHSKTSSTKKVQIQLNFDSDSITFMEDSIPLDTTSNGLHSLPLRETKALLNKMPSVGSHHKITLCVIEPQTNK